MSWSTELLIAGIITHVGVMEKAGRVDYVANGRPDRCLVGVLRVWAGLTSGFHSN